MQTGKDTALVAVQMRITLEDYQSERHLANRIDHLLGSARSRVKPDASAMVVFPEDVGLGMLFIDDYEAVKGCKSIYEAAEVLSRRYASPLQQVIDTHKVSPTRALLVVLGKKLRSRYHRIFSQLARKHRVTLVAGSAPLPDTKRVSEVYNTSYVFDHQGRLILSQRKVHLIPLEQQEGMDLCAGRVEDLRVVDTPAGRLGVAICWDGFHADVVETLVKQKARLIAQPSFNPLPWTPEQAESWKTGLWQACQQHPEIIGINPMMVGRLFEDVVVEGRSSIVAHASQTRDGSGYLAQATSATEEEILIAHISPS
ncbi:MAG: carbon-nitrogen hydrolase family protein [Chthonomonadetes bacterium]|nr:carbon-nitrogen hydrolase family protein [Chthonomonadetes bacterium]